MGAQGADREMPAARDKWEPFLGPFDGNLFNHNVHPRGGRRRIIAEKIEAEGLSVSWYESGVCGKSQKGAICFEKFL